MNKGLIALVEYIPTNNALIEFRNPMEIERDFNEMVYLLEEAGLDTVIINPETSSPIKSAKEAIGMTKFIFSRKAGKYIVDIYMHMSYFGVLDKNQDNILYIHNCK